MNHNCKKEELYSPPRIGFVDEGWGRLNYSWPIVEREGTALAWLVSVALNMLEEEEGMCEAVDASICRKNDVGGGWRLSGVCEEAQRAAGKFEWSNGGGGFETMKV